MKWPVGLWVAVCLASASVWAEDVNDVFGSGVAAVRSAIVFESAGQKTDMAFIEMAHRGADQARKELGIKFDEYDITSDTSRESKLRAIAGSGPSEIVAVGFENVLPVSHLAPLFPHVHFIVIDGKVPGELPNVQSILFRDEEGAFLVGMLAAESTKTGIIGFIGGMDVPLIRNFASGYEQGAHYVNKDVKILQSMIGDTREAWNNPERAGELARLQYVQNADIIFAAAGGSSLGVLAEAANMKKLAIGIDSNQNALYPGNVLTSLIKRVDLAVFNALRMSRDGQWKPGTVYLSAADGYEDYAIDRNNRALVTRKMIDRIETVKDLILRGVVRVKPYTPDS